MQLFYSQNLTPNDTQFSFTKEESRHIAKVLRKQINEKEKLLDKISKNKS
jgi:16S rRNA (uracil1498-N3)-methyltransferase